ncbi:MAG: protein-glutamate O-methyltransferase CheR [Nitrospirota bacterium]|nr:MAG: protein-glutamate O-methyltransferase CheR [Nitrospirota bacterium]
MLTSEINIPLGDQEFRLIRDLVRDYCGIFFDDGSKYIVERRLARRVAGHHFENFRDYYRFLRYDKRREEELAAIMDILTVNETYFFREQNQLAAFSDEILAVMEEKKKGLKKFRVWSAGCSTGEEPYTIAMLLIESGRFRGWDVEVVGSDINQRVLNVAREGVYRNNSFRTTEEYYKKRYFAKSGDSTYKISDEVRAFVNFSYMNLLDPFKIKFLGHFDVIFCRNVMIYFDLESRKKVVNMFHDRMNDGGFLLLGHAESLINISTAFTLNHLKNDMVYQKPGRERKGS